ncbi:hypothetical protein VNO78_06906 [Psophocarpus tetragonolobus]|uniref:Uncharacterized protein n=1 Tax=Psophocarpus tetragonolobus TaxID=3891 RepID=A0AAN9SVP2_PSOTE
MTLSRFVLKIIILKWCPYCHFNFKMCNTPYGWNFVAVAYVPWKMRGFSFLPVSLLPLKESLKVQAIVVEVLEVEEVALVIAQPVDSLLG